MLTKICNYAIEFLFSALFFIVPLIFLPVNFELFEFNKMITTYALTVLIGFFWALKMVSEKRFSIQRTPLDVPILLFLASQIISTLVSIDIHTSLWGYYSRFNGGLVSMISYVFLYYAFVSNVDVKQLKRLLLVALASGLLVSIYGILEHFGIDKDYWVQDVQNRVFSTLGQPNWLAAYVSILIPISIAFIPHVILRTKSEESRSGSFALLRMTGVIFFVLTALYYIALLYTKSRSGFLGLAIGAVVFLLLSFPRKRESRDAGSPIKSGMTKGILAMIVALTFLIGSPFSQLDIFSLSGVQNFIKHNPITTYQKPQGPALEVGGTESGEIRKIVWKGALDIAKAYPLFGSGVETFAYSYTKFRPIEHNRVSEWDFLYNKAHNEYLNYLATTGIFGLGSYLLLIGSFLFIYIRGQKVKESENKTMSLALVAGYISILVSNFFGFSVVIINIFFFLIPAFVFVLNNQLSPNKALTFPLGKSKAVSIIAILFVLVSSSSLLVAICRMWLADTQYAAGKRYERSDSYQTAYSSYINALKLRDSEPNYSDALSFTAASLALLYTEEKESTIAAQFVDQAVALSDATIHISPNNPNFWRTRIRTFYALSQVDEKYFTQTEEAAKKAMILAPTDPKVAYNYALILGQEGKLDEAIEELKKTIALKLDYHDPIYALGLFYHSRGTDNKGFVTNRDDINLAIAQMELLLKMSPNDSDAQKNLDEWKKL